MGTETSFTGEIQRAILEFIGARDTVTSHELKAQLFDANLSPKLNQAEFVHCLQVLVASKHISQMEGDQSVTLALTPRGRYAGLPLLQSPSA